MGKLFKIYLPNGPKMKFYHDHQLHENEIKEKLNTTETSEELRPRSHKRAKLSNNTTNQLYEKYANPNDELKTEENSESINNDENDVNMLDTNNCNDSDDGWSIGYSSSSEDEDTLISLNNNNKNKKSKNNEMNTKTNQSDKNDGDIEIKDKSTKQSVDTDLEVKNDDIIEFNEETNDNIRVCAYCGTHITSDDYLVSNAFTGRTGNAYLYDRAFNVILGESGKRKFSTGVHYASDIYCILCGSNLGWTYFHAQADSQQYKIGCYCLEIKLLKKSYQYYKQHGVSVSLPFNYNTFIKKYKNINDKKKLQLYQKLCQKSNNNNNSNNESESGSPQHLSRPSVGSNISIENLDQDDDDEDDDDEEDNVEGDEDENIEESHTDEIMHDIDDDDDEDDDDEEDNVEGDEDENIEESHTDEIMHDIDDDDDEDENQEEVSNEQDSELFEAN